MTGPATPSSPTTPPAASARTVAEAVAQVLAPELGHVFGVVGSGNFHLTNALAAAGVPFTAARHEGGAATMADAFARVTGRVAAVSVHQGCGYTNALTGIGEAAKSATGLLVLAADTPAGTVGSNFDVDQDALARAVGAQAHRITSARTAEAEARAALAAAAAGAAVVLSLPIDVQAEPAPSPTAPPRAEPSHAGPAEGAETTTPRTTTHAPRPMPPQDAAQDAAVTAVAAVLAHARRPVILAGRGARHAGDELVHLAERSGALLATSAVAHGLFEGHPWSLGISGGFSTPTAAELIAGADAVVAFGCALNDWTTRHGRLIGPDAVLIQVDRDPAAIGRHRPVTHAVVGDAAAVARAVVDSLEIEGEAAATPTAHRTEEVRARLAARGRWNDEPLAEHGGDLGTPGPAGRIDPRVLSDALDRMLPAQRTVAVDSGNFMGYPAQWLRVPDEQGFVFTQAFQAVGLGLATAVGAALARPDRLPVLGAGDGGFLMGVSELETAVRLGLPLLAVVYDDAAYGAEVHHFGPDADLAAVTFPHTDLAALGRGFGAEALTVRAVEDLAFVTDWLERAWDADAGRARPGAVPLVLDARIASDGGAWWLQEAFGH